MLELAGGVPWIHTRNVVWGPWSGFGLLRQSLVQPQVVPLSTDEPVPRNLGKGGNGPTGRTTAKTCQGTQLIPSSPLPHKWSCTLFHFLGFAQSGDEG